MFSQKTVKFIMYRKTKQSKSNHNNLTLHQPQTTLYFYSKGKEIIKYKLQIKLIKS